MINTSVETSLQRTNAKIVRSQGYLERGKSRILMGPLFAVDFD